MNPFDAFVHYTTVNAHPLLVTIFCAMLGAGLWLLSLGREQAEVSVANLEDLERGR